MLSGRLNSRLKSGCVRYHSVQNLLATSSLLKSVKIKIKVSRPPTTLSATIFENLVSTVKIKYLGVMRFVNVICVPRDRNHNNGFGPFDINIGRPWIKIQRCYNFVCFTWVWKLVCHFELGTQGDGGRKWDVKKIILA